MGAEALKKCITITRCVCANDHTILGSIWLGCKDQIAANEQLLMATIAKAHAAGLLNLFCGVCGNVNLRATTQPTSYESIEQAQAYLQQLIAEQRRIQSEAIAKCSFIGGPVTPTILV